ncbi:hypothetical protein GCM10027162_13460 [Streptomyces incanus]
MEACQGFRRDVLLWSIRVMPRPGVSLRAAGRRGQPTPAGGFSYQLTRTLDAPAVKVWRAWTTPEQYAQWAYAAAGSTV